MDLIEGMMTQKSIRRYSDEPVTEDEILQCLRAAIQAPNGGNSQPWQWLVVTDADKRRRIGEIYKRAWDRYWPAITRDAELPDSEEERERGMRTARSAIHLSEHMGEAPAMVMLLGHAEYKNFQLLDDDGHRGTLGENARRHAEAAFDGEAIAARFEAVLERVVHGPGTRRSPVA